MMIWERFTRQEIEQFVKESNSYAQLAEKCGYQKKSGSAVSSIKKMIDKLGLDISHFKVKDGTKIILTILDFSMEGRLKVQMH